MSREIKFRAWNKLRNQMEYDVYKEYNNLMQYTGLKDKNGIEIYEGDIIKYSHNYTGEIMREVVFKYGSYGIEGTTKGTHIIFGNILESEREVIGNIYKNPELLKEEVIDNE
ncbi:hypothetical protein DVW08_12715 [Clostridium botulinum]|nr:hypothetical protein [Clostridium botulinum]